MVSDFLQPVQPNDNNCIQHQQLARAIVNHASIGGDV